MTLSSKLASAATVHPGQAPAFEPITHFLFDNDGVNIDSETVAMRVMDTEGVALVERYVADHGMEQDFIYRTYPGTSTDKIVEALINKFDLPVAQIAADYNLDVEAIKKAHLAKSPDAAPLSDLAAVAIGVADDITVKTIEHFKEHLTAIDGAPEAVHYLRKKYGGNNVALCTTSREDRMDVSLAYATDKGTGWNSGLENAFPKGPLRISGYDVANKYDMAFDLLGPGKNPLSPDGSTAEFKPFLPQNTLVTEDSTSGVKKAKQNRPDVRVLGTVAAEFFEDKPGQAKKLIEAGADIVITTMHDHSAAVEWLQVGLDPAKKPEFTGEVYLPADFAAPALDPHAPGAALK